MNTSNPGLQMGFHPNFPKSDELERQSFRRPPHPTQKDCNGKHLWARASLERDVVTRPSPATTPNCRHSSFLSKDASLRGSNGSLAVAEKSVSPAGSLRWKDVKATSVDGGGSAGGNDLINSYNNVFRNSSGPNSSFYQPSRYSCPSGSDWNCDNCAGIKTKSLPGGQNEYLYEDRRCCCYLYEAPGERSLGGSVLGLDYEDRLLQLESDKDTLHLQVSVLSDQIEAQTSKIKDLEASLEDKKMILETTEEKLQKELVTRSGLETQKLELMAEISGLRLKQAALEREIFELKGRFCIDSGGSFADITCLESRYRGGNPHIVVRGISPAPTMELCSRGLVIANGSNGDQGWTTSPRGQAPPTNSYFNVDPCSTYGTLPRRSQQALRSSVSNTFSTFRKVDNITKCSSLSSGNINDFNQFGGNENSESLKGHKIAEINSSTKNESIGSHTSRRILKILGKLKRGNSVGFDNVSTTTEEDYASFTNSFLRGGLRSTAAPRLGWMKEKTPEKVMDRPVAFWNSEDITAWLNSLGLSSYAPEVKRWVKSGQQLLDASPEELEKELNIKNCLHRKKLALALHFLKNPDDEDNAGKLDYHWVTRWLDDVGLPQYKVNFAEARVDGRMLSRLTTEDLLVLKVTSAMHHLSLKRGVQILRIHRFNPSCLCRRGSNVGVNLDNSAWKTMHVATWTNHRVMEWLKAVDLAEYAPNLRGSGVHGALILFEPSFNAELLATLLSIPGNKTLLRRHLSLQFNDLVGRYMVQEKRLAKASADFVPINPALKVKAIKKSQFPMRKKRITSEFLDELLCPIEWDSFPAAWDNMDNFDPDRRSSDTKVSNI